MRSTAESSLLKTSLLLRVNTERLDWNESIDKTIGTIGHSITLTSIILIGAFSVVTLSTFMPVFATGFFFRLAIVMAWAMDLLLVPVLLRYWGTLVEPETSKQPLEGAAEG